MPQQIPSSQPNHAGTPVIDEERPAHLELAWRITRHSWCDADTGAVVDVSYAGDGEWLVSIEAEQLSMADLVCTSMALALSTAEAIVGQLGHEGHPPPAVGVPAELASELTAMSRTLGQALTLAQQQIEGLSARLLTQCKERLEDLTTGLPAAGSLTDQPTEPAEEVVEEEPSSSPAGSPPGVGVGDWVMLPQGAAREGEVAVVRDLYRHGHSKPQAWVQFGDGERQCWPLDALRRAFLPCTRCGCDMRPGDVTAHTLTCYSCGAVARRGGQ